MRWIDRSVRAEIVVLLLCACVVSGAQQRPSSSSGIPSSSAAAAPNKPLLPSAQPVKKPQLQFLAVLDPAHGGSDTGAILGPSGPEKSFTLALAVRLHVLLNARGISSTLTRDSDTTVSGAARAETANRAHAAACILLHATATGKGVHLFTSSLPTVQQTDPRRSFLPWQTAQAGYGTQSLRLESDINASLTHQHVPVLLDRTSLMPLDSMACPAVAVEIAPLNAATPLSDSAYQEQVAESLASALAEWRTDWRSQP